MSGWIAFTVVATATIGMITAGIHAYKTWLELQIARSKSDKPQRVKAKAESKSGSRVILYLVFTILLPISGVVYSLWVVGITRLSIFFVFLYSVMTSVMVSVLLAVYVLMQLKKPKQISD